MRNITIELLGYCENGMENPILNKLQKYVSVNYPTGYISAHDFDVKGTDCQYFLFSPLLPSMEYGTYKGTGAISDAIYLRRNIILPEACDPCKEFDDIAYYYLYEK